MAEQLLLSIQHLNHGHVKMQQRASIHSVTQLIGKCRSRPAQPSPQPTEHALFPRYSYINLITAWGRFFFKLQKVQKTIFRFYSYYNLILFPNVLCFFFSFGTENKFSPAIASRIRPRKLQPWVRLALTVYLKLPPRCTKSLKWEIYTFPNYIKNENFYSKPAYRLCINSAEYN